MFGQFASTTLEVLCKGHLGGAATICLLSRDCFLKNQGLVECPLLRGFSFLRGPTVVYNCNTEHDFSEREKGENIQLPKALVCSHAVET